jgi:hypothetical protein
MKMEQTECSEMLAHKFRHWGITQKKEYNIQNIQINQPTKCISLSGLLLVV